MTDDIEFFLKADIIECDKPTASGIIYPREIVEKAVADLQERCIQGTVLGTFEPSDPARLVLSEVSHTVDNVSLSDEGVLTAECTILPTYRGKMLTEHLRAHPKKDWRGLVQLYPLGKGRIADGRVEEYQMTSVGVSKLPLQCVCCDGYGEDDQGRTCSECMGAGIEM